MKNRKALLPMLFFFIIFLSLIITSTLLAVKSTPPLLDEEILKRIQDEVSGSICFEHIRFLSTLDRNWGSKDYHLAAEYLITKAKQYGLKNVKIESYSQKKENDKFWKHVVGGLRLWDCQEGSLRLVKPYPMLISDYESAAGTVARGSHSTDIKAEIVFVGRGDSEEDYLGKDVKGKIALAERGSPMRVHPLAVHKFGALGTIRFPDYRGRFPEETDSICPLPIWPYADGKKEPTFGFNLSEPKGRFLKALLEKGEKVVVSANIKAKLDQDAAFELATAIIPGTTYPDEEFIFYAHLDHTKPGAHDNASGDAVVLEIARTLSSLIQKKIIPPPKRTIRFMWIPHVQGLQMYFSNHPEKMGKVLGGCNLDCVGVDQAKFPANFHIGLPPHSLASILTDITNNLVDYFNRKIIHATHGGPTKNLFFSPEGSRNLFSIHIMPMTGASDHLYANQKPLSIPSINFHDYPLPPRHSQINFLNYIDRTNLKRYSYLGAIISYAFTSAGEEMAPRLMNEIQYRGKNRLEQELIKAKTLLEESNQENIHQDFAKGKNLLVWGIKREKRLLGSLNKFFSNNKSLEPFYSKYTRMLKPQNNQWLDELQRYYKQTCKNLHIKPLKKLSSSLDPSWRKIIPVINPTMKNFPGCGQSFSYFREKLGDDYFEKYKGFRSAINKRILSESFNYMDGHNTVIDIFDAVQAELWSEDYSPRRYITFEEMVDYFRLLKDAQIIELKKK